MRNLSLVLNLCVLSLISAGCGSSSSSSVSTSVAAATGGTVAMPDKSAQVTIPAGALAANTVITIQLLAKTGLPDQANLTSDPFEFGPTGTAFSTPATLSLTFTGQVADGKEVVLAVLGNGAWTAVEGSSASAGAVTGPISHFSTYIILTRDKKVVPTGPCAQAFAACGGDPIGTWTAVDYCMNPTGIPTGGGDNPFADIPGCEDAQLIIAIGATGTLVIEQGGAFNSNLSSTSTLTGVFNSACLQGLAAKDTSGATYTDEQVCTSLTTLAAQMFPKGCVYGSSVCTCTSNTETGSPTVRTGTWAVDGTNLNYTIGSNTVPNAFCIDGTQLKIQTPRSSSSSDILDVLVFTK